jgi:Tol biopolymer transport system component
VLSITKLADKSSRVIAKFVGTSESLGAQPWSPDGRKVVFISYQTIR